MAMTTYTGDTAVITNIGTTPDERGLTTEEFKAKFDLSLQDFVTWFNETHKTEFESVQTNVSSISLSVTSRRIRNIMGVIY